MRHGGRAVVVVVVVSVLLLLRLKLIGRVALGSVGAAGVMGVHATPRGHAGADFVVLPLHHFLTMFAEPSESFLFSKHPGRFHSRGETFFESAFLTIFPRFQADFAIASFATSVLFVAPILD